MKKNDARFQVENGHCSIPDRLKWLPFAGNCCKNYSRGIIAAEYHSWPTCRVRLNIEQFIRTGIGCYSVTLRPSVASVSKQAKVNREQPKTECSDKACLAATTDNISRNVNLIA